ncbi:hypothetical protein [Collimonas antrihumi]|uniref:hypothetical protein n=1 Tax=Collimonas antrihumi TaxID=1940615 RepID=UPI001B8CFE8A|nr:hypothetical protein [Collimonas antrihumi]
MKRAQVGWSRGFGIEKDIERCDFSAPNDDHIPTRVLGSVAAWAGIPSFAAGVVKGLMLAVRRIYEVRMRRRQFTREFVERIVPESGIPLK